MPTVRFPRNPGGRLAATARATLALPALALAALALAAGCGDDSDVVIVALTRTPTPEATAEAAPRTPPSPTASTATPVVAPSSALPPPPQSLLAGANALAPYLAGGAADLEGCVPEVVAAWGFAEIEGPRCVLADLDGDGGDEFALVVTLPRQGETRPGDVWVFADVRRDARLQASARALANAVLGDVSIVAADDLTGDGLPEIVVSSRTCGAAICSTDFLIISAHRGVLEDLAPEDIEVAALDSAVVEDVTGDGRPDLVLRGGVIASAGAGPPRAFRRSLAWSGLRFFVDEQPEPPRYLFHAIADADALFASADYAGARDGYEQAAADTTLADWRVESGSPPGRPELVPYALLRAGLAALRQGDGVGATALLDRALRGHERTLHGLSAATYRASLNEGGTPAEACALVETFLQSRASQFARIWDYGFANPEHHIADLCR